ncbi:MAG: tetratricopeptide repeat protein [Acidobacteria bacterium]|nr:tetratricopeptide repeat protein [Acidobacteriota bacterium]
MTAENSRLDELRRRLQQDPASIVFAQLAEECRRSGHLDEAVHVCRAGLVHHPSYLSARVTLGRALMALGQSEDAKAEFEVVLQAAPDNLLARKSLDELQSSAHAPAARAAPDPVDPPAPEAVDPPAPEPTIAGPPETGHADVQTPTDPVLGELEGWLAEIRADRSARIAGGT